MRSASVIDAVLEKQVLPRSTSVVTSHVRECHGSCEDRGRSITRKGDANRRRNRSVRACEDDEAGGWNWREEYGELISF